MYIATKQSSTDLLCGYSIDWFTLVQMCYKCRYGCTERRERRRQREIGEEDGNGQREIGEEDDNVGFVQHSQCLLC